MEVPAADTSQISIERGPDTVSATLGSDVLFSADSAVLGEQSREALEQLLATVESSPGAVVVTGHVNAVPGADPAGDERLSLERAQAVADWLVSQGVERSRIAALGAGAREPVYPSPTTEDERQANRRVVVVIHTQVG